MCADEHSSSVREGGCVSVWVGDGRSSHRVLLCGVREGVCMAGGGDGYSFPPCTAVWGQRVGGGGGDDHTKTTPCL